MELSLTFAPMVDESPMGYYRRLSAENALWSWKELASMAGVSPSRTGLLSEPAYLAEVLHLDPAWTESLSAREANARSWHTLHRFGHDALCPTCLGESVHLRAYWEHGYAVACHVHGTQLIDRCPACGDFLSHNRERIELCHCGCDLRTALVCKATPAQLWLANLLASAGASTGGIQPNVAGAAIRDVASLIRVLCHHAEVTEAGPRRNSAAPRSVQEAIAFLGSLDGLLADWPRQFEAHVSARIAAGDAEARTLNSLLGRWYQQVKSVGSEGPLQVFLKAVVGVAAREFDGILDHAVTAEIGVASHVPVASAAKVLGIGRDSLVQSLKAGKAGYRTRRLGTRGLCYEVEEFEVKRIKHERDRWLPMDVAASSLGVGRSILERMGATGLVTVDNHWRQDLLKGGPVLSESLRTFESAARAHVMKSKTSESTIAIKELTSRRIGDKRAIESVLRAIHSGELVAVAAGGTLGSFRYKVSDVKRYFGRPVLEAGLSVNQLAKVTGWKWESVRHWIDEKLLESHEIVLRGQPCRVVMPEQLLAFCQTYVPLATLAHAADSRSSALLERLGDIPLVGGKPLPGGAVRGALVKLSDLAQAALLPGLRETAAVSRGVVSKTSSHEVEA